MPMDTRNPVSSANLMGHPLHPMLVTLPIGLWVATFAADIGYWVSGVEGCAAASPFLLGAAILTAAFAAVAGLIDFMGDARIRAIGDAWQHAIGNVVAVLVSLFNFYWRYRYGPAGILPTGLILSAIVVLIILFTGWKGGEMVFRHRVAVYDEPR